MEAAGHKCVGFCEFDKFARASYISMHCITEEQRAYLATLDFKKRQREILKEEYLNGEWCSTDIRNVNAGNIPKADIWCYGAPCQSFSIAGRRKGLEGESGLVREVFRILGEIRGEDRPEWLIYENVRGMLSSSRGFDFLAILCEMDGLGYDVEWQNFNTKDHGPPQNRDRIYTIGHSRNFRSTKILPITPTDREDSVEIEQMGQRDRDNRKNLNQYRVYDPKGLAPCLNKMDGGGREPMIGIEVVGKRDPNRVAQMDIMGVRGVMRTLDTMHEPKTIAVPVTISNKTGIGGGYWKRRER